MSTYNHLPIAKTNARDKQQLKLLISNTVRLKRIFGEVLLRKQENTSCQQAKCRQENVSEI